MSKLRRQISANTANTAETKDLNAIKAKTGNVYESIAIIAKRANQINISLKEELHNKLEEKEYSSATLYYNMGHYRAAAIAYTSLMNDFPDSQKSDAYKLQVIKSYYLFAVNSIEDKKAARFEQVVTECHDFVDRFPESTFKKEVENYETLSKNNLKANNNEQITKTN